MKIKKADTQAEFFAIVRIRAEVFMCEQHVDPLLEIDEEDAHAIHYVVYSDEGEIVATCRQLMEKDFWYVGRVAVLKPYRKKHIGAMMLEHVEKEARKAHIGLLKLGAQRQAQAFYEKQGYEAYGETYLDADIPHVHMEKRL